MILEVQNIDDIPKELEYELLGKVISMPLIKIGMDLIPIDMLLATWEQVLEEISPVNADHAMCEIMEIINTKKGIS
jgi:hypothetical protein